MREERGLLKSKDEGVAIESTPRQGGILGEKEGTAFGMAFV